MKSNACLRSAIVSLAGLTALASLSCRAQAQAQEFTIWNAATSTPAVSTGTITDANGPITVTLATTGAASGDSVQGALNSSQFGTFFGGRTAAQVYGATLPGTNDFNTSFANTNASVWSLTFSRAVLNPVFYVYNLDFRLYTFSNATPTVLSGLNLSASGNTAQASNPAQFDNGDFSDPNKGNPNGSAYGSFQLSGTYTTLTWTRPLGPGGFVTDGNRLGVSISPTATAVPEPGSIALLIGMGVTGASFLARKRRK